jgi:sigma-B regulation protein RsbU (phosphoserine phosphatase)
MASLRERPNAMPQGARVLASADHLDAVRRLQLLTKISSKLAALRSERQLLEEVVDLLHLFFERACFVEVVVVDRCHELSVMYSRERDRGLKTLTCGGIDALPEDRRAEFAVPRVIPGRGRESSSACGDMMSVPLLDGETLLGLVVIEAVSGGRFGQVDLDEAEGVAAQVATALQRLRVGRLVEEGRRIESDLKSAKRIQRALLPELPEILNGFRVAAEYLPAFDVGGDFYDAVALGPGQVMAIIGDVAGKGVSGALVMSRVATELKRLIKSSTSPARLLQQLNESFALNGCGEESFVTAAAVLLDGRRRRLTIANAGHVLPLIRRASGAVLPIGGASGPPIGMLPAQSYVDEPFALQPGDQVVLMTDGVLEALHKEGDQLGMTTLLGLIGKAPRNLCEINRRILDAVERHAAGKILDDVALLSLEVTRAG